MDILSAVIGVSTLLTIIGLYYKFAFQYWISKKVPSVKATVPFGSCPNPFWTKKPLFEQLASFYSDLKAKNERHFGMYLFAKPIYVPVDLELVRCVLTKDFSNFTDRGTFVNEEDDPLTAHLFSLEGQKWRGLRAKLSPTFTSGKLKNMFSTLVAAGQQLDIQLQKLGAKGEPLDIKDILGRFSTDIIGSCAFGIDCNSFENPNSDFRIYGKKAFQQNIFDSLKNLFGISCPKLARFLRMRIINKDVHKFFMGLADSSVKHREAGSNTRKDFMQLLVDLKHSEESSLTLNEIAAQAFVFFLAGFETSSTTMTFCLFELARNPEIQERVRKEITGVMEKYRGEVTYEALKEMKYLGQVVDETLRMYPPVPILNRQCTKPFRIPDSDVILEKDVGVFIPVHAIHHDPEYYPDPDKFDPERFLQEAKMRRHPYSYLPFGEGPRNCIGLRFGLMQTKVGLSVILKNFKLTINEKSVLPLTMNPYTIVMTTNETVLLDVERI